MFSDILVGNGMLEMTGPPPDLEQSALEVFSKRLGRFCYLKLSCESHHPVLVTESHLLEIARSKLRERLLLTFPIDTIPLIRPELEFKIKHIAKKKLRGMAPFNDLEILDKNIDEYDLNGLFNF